MFAGEAVTEMAVTVGVTATVTLVEADLVASWVEVAVIMAVPDPEGVNTPPPVMVPSVDVQVIAVL
jgi:hypothetical protein